MPTALPKRGLAVALVVSLVTTVLTASPTPAAPYRPPSPNKERVIAGEKAGLRKNEDVRTGSAFTGAAPVWPKAAVAEVDLGVVAANKTARAADTPVSVAADVASASTAKVKPKIKVETFDRDKTRAVGVDGLLFKVSGGPAKVEVNYSSFRWAYGGDWASRLRLVELPECALSTPGKPECAAKPVPSRNDRAKGTVTATEASPSSGAFMALAAGTSSGSGTHSATSLSSSATWSAGSNTGAFTWNYPLRMPPSLGGPTPALALAYSSSSVDGRMVASNNQPSWIGEGFELGANFIERKYVGCADDMADGARNTTKTGDLCWRNENATLSMDGRAGELIRESPTSTRWRLRNDDGTRVEFGIGIGNGARNGEHWVVTTPDGTQHWFGRSRQSVLNVPVAGNHASEPCAADAFKDSFCSQPYRWQLEYVVDLHDNTMTYSYDKETNKYARNNVTTDLAEYDRSSVLKQIDYGTRKNSTGTAPMQVVLEPADRCLSDCGTRDAQHWPDVPWDQACDKSPCRAGSPTFWTTKRLASVTTKVGGSPVEKWTLGHSFPDPGDGTRAGLWLDKVSRSGLVGQQTNVPDIRFHGIQLSNRVDTHSDQLAAMKWWRLKTIYTETGGQVDIDYSAPDCVPGSRMPNPNALQDNTLRCYPVRWTPEGNQTPIWDYFHKYVVNNVKEADLTGGSVRVLTQYEYVGDPAWHYTDDDGLIKAEDKTWSVWRGYGKVRTLAGDPGEQTMTETRYFRGMHGDKLPSGTRPVSLPAIATGNISAAVDEDVFAGMVREKITYNGPGGAEVSATVNEPWKSEPTATRTINDVTVYARYAATAGKHSRTALDDERGYRTTSTTTVFDQTYGMATRTEDRGDDTVIGDEKCTLIDYARNTSAWLVGTVSRERAFLVDCAKAQADTGLRDTDIAGGTKNYYDGQAHGVAPVKGEITKTEGLKSYTNGTPAYLTATAQFDVHGRVTKLTDPKGTTSTAYTPATGGPVTQVAMANTLGWVTTTVQQPAWGVPLTIVDVNQEKTEITYDGLGRTTAVWLPGSDQRTHSANKKFSYLERTNGPVVVTTSVLNATKGRYNMSYQLFDGLLRPRQTQQPDATGSTSTAVITDTYYDSAGRAVRSNNAYLANVVPSTERFVPAEVIPSATVTTFDGAGRETVKALKKLVPTASPGGEELFRTTTYYAGDRTDVTPPDGGVVASILVDSLGRKSELRQYRSGVAAGSATGFDATKYTYDLKGQLTAVAHPSGKKWEYSYDLRGRQVRAADPDKGVTTSTYDDADQLLSTTDGRRKTLAYTYDALGRKTSMRDDSPTGAARAEWFYDRLADGTQVNGHLVKSVRHGELGDYTKEHTGMWPDGTPTATAFTIPEDETGLSGTYSYVYGYNADELPEAMIFPDTGDLKRETLRYGYDALNQANTQRSAYGTAQSDLVTGTGYTPFGELASYRLRNGGNAVDVTRNYDQYTRRLSQIWTTKFIEPTDVANVSYDYDAAGNVTRVADSVSSDTQCFSTDYLRRLAEAWTPASGDCAATPTVAGLGGPSKYWQSFSYNAADDRTRLVEYATSAGKRTTEYTPTPGKHSLADTLTTDDAGSRSSSYTYDEVGNTLTRPAPSGATQTMTWDREGRVATTADDSGESSYVYDADGNRLIRRDPAGRTLYLPGQELRYVASSGVKVCTRYYAHAGQAIAMRTSAGLTWMSADQHGTAQNTINALGQQSVSTRRTLPFGEVRGGTGTWPARLDKGFVGGTLDNTGLTHIGAREYDPAIGRFISVDPIMDTADPQQWNGYAYANNSPVTFSDPTGLLAMGCVDDGPCSGLGTRETYTPSAPTLGSDAPGGESPRGRWTRENSPKSTNADRLISIWSTYTTGQKYGLEYWSNDMGDNEYACFGRHGCQLAWIHLSENPNDVAGAKDIAANYCRDNFAECSNGASWEQLANNFLAMAAGGLGAAGVASNRIRAACDPNSFTGETPVLMADGTNKRIDEIKVGDFVLAKDPETGEAGSRKVIATIVGEGVKHLVEIEIDGGKITATDGHPFWLPEQKRWVDAKDLRVGSALQTSTGMWVKVAAIKKRIAIKRVHNLTVDRIHTYYVLARDTRVLVHNCATPAIRISPAASDWATKGAHMHVGSSEIRIFPTGNGGVGFEGLRMSNGMASARDVEMARGVITNSAEMRSDLIGKARSAMADMNAHNWGNSVSRASEMHFLIKALEKIG